MDLPYLDDRDADAFGPLDIIKFLKIQKSAPAFLFADTNLSYHSSWKTSFTSGNIALMHTT
jgi:hypothetical protein